MFGFLLSQAARARRDARNWIEVADKVIHYRRDLLAEGDLGDLQQRRDELKAAVKAKVDAARIKLGIGALEPALHRCGGSVYPKSVTADNVEFFLAAAIVILGVKAFFLQPFKIPTNSMWPTYHGMTAELWMKPSETPGVVERAFRLAAFLAVRHEFIASADGEVLIPFEIDATNTRLRLERSEEMPGRKWLVVPTRMVEYTIYTGGRPSHVRVPSDFQLELAVTEKFFGSAPDLREPLAALERSGKVRTVTLTMERGGSRYERRLRALVLDTKVSRGEVALSFDILGGDQLVVDRFSNHFFPPTVGEGFVFRTGNIPDIRFGDQYYVKRLIGTPGDRIEIRQPALYRNGAPITGATAFEANSSRMGQYRGYFNARPEIDGRSRYLKVGETVTVPADSFFALGDNSANSEDGRYWGFVPNKDAVGRPLFIYYPFTKRWGIAR